MYLNRENSGNTKGMLDAERATDGEVRQVTSTGFPYILLVFPNAPWPETPRLLLSWCELHAPGKYCFRGTDYRLLTYTVVIRGGQSVPISSLQEG